ncbi:unnamed protein product, partial [Trichogramma brassicae]
MRHPFGCYRLQTADSSKAYGRGEVLAPASGLGRVNLTLCRVEDTIWRLWLFSGTEWLQVKRPAGTGDDGCIATIAEPCETRTQHCDRRSGGIRDPWTRQIGHLVDQSVQFIGLDVLDSRGCRIRQRAQSANTRLSERPEK